ncbi:hypothetical protein AKJ09_00622 [Labilithrix luteola]|uniref:Tryptophan synthase alpha chain n=1 Tax=Labilithrix luteola TaxID=1391654 RepID=A0A0K1PK90_9BACT|nr:hypothetical protein AKJ09_00622 [Labilithrix luteola]
MVIADSEPTDDGRFVTLDSGMDGDASALETPLMCPSSTCLDPWRTCPSSKFPCDTNLLTDDENCGGCGIRCGGIVDLTAQWTCVDGQCVFGCRGMGSQNCDKNPSNGCETFTQYDPTNCGTCGTVCPAGFDCDYGICVDACEAYGLPDMCPDGTCTDLQSDDANCGSCGVECDTSGVGLPALHDTMHYGCVGGACGVPKCNDSNSENCNGDLNDGCEANLHTPEHCVSCDDVCPAGKFCGYGGGGWKCLCGEGQTRCISNYPNEGACRSLDDDPLNCGGCDNVCPGGAWPHYQPMCTSGVCGGACQTNYADCDELLDNGCEVDTRVDNRNCGACGHACEPGQACYEGACLVAPCDAGVTAK